MSHNSKLALDLIDAVQADLDRLRGLIQPQTPKFDPKDHRNKTADSKFTPRGVEICYQLFDMGKTRYAVATAMGISFGAASHRLKAWNKVGGPDREKMPLE